MGIRVALVAALGLIACKASTQAVSEQAPPLAPAEVVAAEPTEAAPLPVAERCPPGLEQTLGIPADAVFFLGQLPSKPEPLAGKRWALRASGDVLYSENGAPFDREQIEAQPFNRPYLDEPIATVPGEVMAQLAAEIVELGFFELPPLVKTPEDVEVFDGADDVIMARHVDGWRKCVRFMPTAEQYIPLSKAFGRSMNPYLK